MKIVHVCLAGSYNDDWTYQDNLLSQYHKELGYDVTLITSPFINNTKTDGYLFYRVGEYQNRFGIKIIRLPLIISNNSKIILKLRSYKGLYERLVEEQPDIIFVHGGQFMDLKKVIKYKKRNLKVRLYIDNHADFSNSARSRFSYYIMHKFLWRSVIRKSLPYTEKYYGVLPARVNFLIQMYGLPSNKVELLVMGADDELVEYGNSIETQNETYKKYKISKEDFLIVTGGKIDKAKIQVFDLIEAIKEIGEEKIKLVIFGPIVEELREKMLSKIDNKKINYIEWLDAKGAYGVFGIASLAFFPGRHSVYWEQVVGQGVPIVVKRWEGTTHVDLGGNCIFLEEGSKEEIQKIILELYQNKEKYVKMRTVAKERGCKEFSYLEIAKKSIEYKERRKEES